MSEDFKNIIEIISSNSLLIALFSSALVATGYFFRLRLENKRNKKKALYVLLEIWFRVSIFYKNDYGDLFRRLFEELTKQHPEARMPEEAIEATEHHFTPFIKQAIQKASLSDLAGYEYKYREAISLLSMDDPILAYKISSASKIRELIEVTDLYLASAIENIDKDSEDEVAFAESVKNRTSHHTQVESLEELEGLILKLAIKISGLTYIASLHVISERKKVIHSGMPEEKLAELVGNTILPAINERLRMPAADHEVT